MQSVREPDGSRVFQVNIYKDIYLLKYLFCDLAIDAPGDAVFCSEKGFDRGFDITLLQSRSGFNVLSKEGLGQLLMAILPPSNPFVAFMKRDYETPLEMFKVLAYTVVTGKVPKIDQTEDEFLVDILLLPKLERLEYVRQQDPESMIHSILRIINAFSNQVSFRTYKPLYRSKLLKLASSFAPYRKEFLMFEIDPEHLQDSLYQLVFFFS